VPIDFQKTTHLERAGGKLLPRAADVERGDSRLQILDGEPRRAERRARGRRAVQRGARQDQPQRRPLHLLLQRAGGAR